MPDLVACPFGGISCGKKHVTRPGFGDHVMSKVHANELSEALKKKIKSPSSLYLKPTCSTLPMFETKDTIHSICFGCNKCYNTINSDHLMKCKNKEAHLKKLSEFLGFTEAEATNEITESESDRIMDLTVQIKNLQKQLTAAHERMREMETEAEEDSAWVVKYTCWLRVIIGENGFYNDDIEQLVEDIKAGKRKTLTQLEPL